MSKCSWLDLLQVAAISYSAVIYRSMLLKLQLLCVKAQHVIALNQHILGRHIWDVPISMNTNSSVQVKESLRSLEWQFTILTWNFLLEFLGSQYPLWPSHFSGQIVHSSSIPPVIPCQSSNKNICLHCSNCELLSCFSNYYRQCNPLRPKTWTVMGSCRRDVQMHGYC